MLRKKIPSHTAVIAALSLLCSCGSRTSCDTICETPCATERCASVRDDAPCLQNEMRKNKNSKRLSLLERRFDAITAVNVEGCLQGYSPAHLEEMDWIVSGEILLTKASEDGLEYASKTEENKSFLDFHERIYVPEFDWDLGFRLGIGTIFDCHEDWDLFLNWTYMRNTADSSVKQSPGLTLQPLWGGQGLSNDSTDINTGGILGDFASDAKARWRLNLNILDLELGRDFFISKAITARPFICARGVDVNQHYRAKYGAIFLETPPTPNQTASTSMRSKSHFLGIGPRLGADLLWHINCDWGISCKFAGSLFYGKFNVSQHYQGDIVSVPPSPVDLNYRDNRWRIETEIEAAIGLQWESYFRCDRSHVLVALSYEFSEWFHMNRLARTSVFTDLGLSGNPFFFDPSNSSFNKEYGDLGIQGASLKIRFDF